MKLNKIFAAGYAGDCLALISGILLTFAFAPFNAAPLAVVSPMLILCLWLPVSRVRALYRGWLFGLGFFGSGVYWVFISIHTYGNASVALSAVITCGFILILACFPALTGFVLTRNFPINNNTKILCAFPALWSFLEWIRGWIFTGFPWLSLGYSQINTPLRGYAPLVGVYGLSLLVLLSSSLLLTAILNISSRKKIMFAYKNIFALVLIWVMGGLLNYVSWTRPLADPVKVSLVQGNIPQQLKWSPEELLPTLTRYVTLTKEHLDSSIIIWPEGAVPMSIQAAREFLTKISIMAAHYHTTIITGIPIQASALGGYNNGVIAMGNGTGIYLKQRLVPFGEYIPFNKVLHHLFDILQIPMSDFVPGTEHYPPLRAGSLQISAFICYEIAYPEQVLFTNPDINMLLTVSNDAWFGRSIAQPQHLQIAQMRALELGRPLLFVSNNGITAIVNAKGQIQERIPAFETGVLTGMVQPYHGRTPWQYTGMDPWCLGVLILLIIAISRRKNP